MHFWKGREVSEKETFDITDRESLEIKARRCVPTEFPRKLVFKDT